MKYDETTMKKVLENIGKDPKRIIYTEHFDEQIARRNFSDTYLEKLLENGTPIEIKKIEDKNNRFELDYHSEEYGNLGIIVDIFLQNAIVLISVFRQATNFGDSSHALQDMECIYDLAFDMMDMHVKHETWHFQTVEMGPGFNIDFDSCGNPVAVEIICPSKMLKIKNETLSSSKIEVSVEISAELIRARVKAKPTSAKINSRTVEREVRNAYGISPGRHEFLVSEIL